MYKNKVFTYISYVTIALALAIILLITFWSVYPYETIVVNGTNVINRVVKQDETLQYTLDYCKYTERDVLISRRFVDGIIFSVPDVTASNPEGCRKSLIGIEIPTTLPPGTYYLDIIYAYKVNPIRTMATHSRTELFIVEPK